MDRLDLIKLFVRVVECGSFSAAARDAGIGQPAVSKHIAALEEQLHVELIWRSSRTLRLTEAGQSFYESSLRLLEEYQSAVQCAALDQGLPRGLLRVMASPTFGRLYVTPFIAEFQEKYPEIAIELLTSDSPSSVIEKGVDIAFHGGELSDSSLVVRKIAESVLVTVATPEYLDRFGIPEQPADLARFNCIGFIQSGAVREWVIWGDGGKTVVRPQGSFRTNDAEQVRLAVMSHIGIANAPAWLFNRELESGAVKRLLTAVELSKPIFAIRPSGRSITAKVQVFLDYMEATLARRLTVMSTAMS